MDHDFTNLTDAQIEKRLKFADMLIGQLKQHDKEPKLPSHLEKEVQDLLAEQQRRQLGVAGEGI